MGTTPLWSTFGTLSESVGNVEAILAPARDSLRFADLPKRLLYVRDALARCGIGPGDRVVSVLPRGPETAVCYLGVAACAIYIPLNPDFTEAEFNDHLTRLRPKAVIVPEGGGGAARVCADALGIRIIELVVETTKPAGTFVLTPRFALPSERALAEPGWNGPENFALVLLTSGSTAKHKAVPLRVRHLLAYARGAGAHYRLDPNDRCLHVMPMFHGHGLKSCLVVPLANGSGVICSPDFDIPSFFHQMKALRPTWYSAAASIHHAILANIDGYRDIARAANLRFIRSGSSRLDPKVMAGLETAFAAPMLERYGMSECGTLTANPLPPEPRKAGTVGKIMENNVAIIDEGGQILGPNREGEVIARGPSVFDGYLDDPTASAAAFVDGWFRTGDLGRFDDEGYLTIVGRIKDLINRGGEKIATAEIEAALSKHPAVAEVCAFGVPHPSLGEEVAAAVIVAADHTVSEQELRTHARGLLTGIKVPRRVFFLPSLPRSATNKVRRDQVAGLCRDLLAESPKFSESKTRMWTPLEREIGKAWKRIIKLDSIELDDDFFLVGGDSLKAYELFASLRKAYRVTLGLRQVFDQAATVAGMARLIESARQDKAKAPGSTRLVTIKEDGDWPPLFSVPGSDGNPVTFIHLGRLLDARQPLIGIEARGIDGKDAPLDRIEDIAADNIERIREIQPKGPYFLTGACYGGRVAYEMARQLEAAGESIGLLLMLDPSSPFHNADGRQRGAQTVTRRNPQRMLLTRFVVDRVALHSRAFLKLRGPEWWAFMREKIATLRGMIESRDPFRGDRSELFRRAVSAANSIAGQTYVPGRFGGPAFLCFTRHRKTHGERNYRLDWVDFVPQVGSPTFVSGKDSGDMLNLPYVYELADVLNKRLEAAHAKAKHAAPSRVLSPLAAQ